MKGASTCASTAAQVRMWACVKQRVSTGERVSGCHEGQTSMSLCEDLNTFLDLSSESEAGKQNASMSCCSARVYFRTRGVSSRGHVHGEQKARHLCC